jgi:hypothetical protein
MGFFLLSWMVLGGLTLVNMLVGIIVDIVAETKKDEEEKLLVNQVRQIFMEIDEDDSGLITDVEFKDQSHMLKAVGMDNEICDLAFDLMDAEESRMLPVEDFLNMIFKLMRPPETTDILIIQQNIEKLCEKLGVDPLEAPLKSLMEDPAEMSDQAKIASDEALAKYTLKKTSAGIKLVPKQTRNIEYNMKMRQEQAQSKSMKSLKVKQFGA